MVWSFYTKTAADIFGTWQSSPNFVIITAVDLLRMEVTPAMPLIIGITGSITTGKSTACELLVEQGAILCDADRLVHRLYDPGKPAFDRIVDVFGVEVVGEDGYIDRKALGSKVFGKPDEMTKLTTAIGDIAAAVKQVVDEWNQNLGKHDVALLEAVNLVEAGYGQWCHQVWLFACDQNTARLRLMSRNGFTEEEATQRLASQRPWEDRAPASDTIIFNDGSQDELKERVRSEFTQVFDAWKADNLKPSKYQEWWGNKNIQLKQT